MKFLVLIISAFVLPLHADPPRTTLACGSCYKPERDKGLWPIIAAHEPQAFLFLGDNIYADTDDPEVMRQKYKLLNAQPDYAEFAKKIPIIPIWDDHDYGRNDAGAEYEMKQQAQELFFDAFRFPADHPARQTPGIYHSRTLEEHGKKIHLIMLDTRYFRSAIEKETINKRKTYLPATGAGATVLGEAQWKWLANELEKPADLRIIASSIQVISDAHRFEKWANFPDERTRFFKLVSESPAIPTILLSGDRHMSEVCALPAEKSGLPFDLYELTSSGLTHAGAPDDPSEYRIPDTYTNDLSYGLIEIVWSTPRPTVILKINDQKGQAITSTPVKL